MILELNVDESGTLVVAVVAVVAIGGVGRMLTQKRGRTSHRTLDGS